MTTLERSLLEILGRFRGASPDVQGSAVVAADGQVLVMDLNPDLDASAIDGVAGLVASGNALSEALWGKPLKINILRSDSGHAVIRRLESGTALVVLAGLHTRLGMLLLEVEVRLPEISRALQN